MSETSAPTIEVPKELAEYLEERIAEGRLELPMLPDVASKTVLLCQSETADAAQISSLVHRDQALASHLLRIANSALYASSVPIVSLQQAISRLGLKLLAEMVIAITVGSRVFRVQGHEALMKRLWRHAVVAGVFAKEIARARRRNVEGAFLCGLLHDVGKPVLMTAIVDWQTKSACEMSSAVLHATLDAYHAQVGHELALRWKLPDQIQVAIRFHHDLAGASAHAEAAMIACLADMLSYEALRQPGASTEQAIRAHQVIEHLNLYPDDLDSLFAARERALADAEALVS